MATHSLDSQRRFDFVGRSREVSDFDAILGEVLPQDRHRLLALHAQGGQGKSALLGKLRAHAQEKREGKAVCALLDLADPSKRDLEPALVQLRHEFQRGGLATPAFDVAFARAFALAHPGKEMRSEYPEFFSAETSVLGDLIDLLGTVVNEIPGGKLIYTHLAKTSSRIRDWYRREGHTVLQHLDDKSLGDLRLDLPMYLGYDLSCSRKRNAATQPIVFVDTYEALWSAEGIAGNRRSSGPDSWLRRLVQESPGILFVVAGRRAVDWTRIDPDWGAVVRPIPLDALRDEDVGEFLRHAAVEESDIREHLCRVAAGHPLTLQLLTSSYAKLRARGRRPTLDDFPRVQAEVLDRFFSHLDRPSLAVIRALAIPSSIPAPLWDHFRRGRFSAFDLCSPAEILGEAFFSSDSDGLVYMHESVRVAAVESLREEDPTLLRQLRLCVVDFVDCATSPESSKREGTQIPDLSKNLSRRDACFQEASRILMETDETLFVSWSIEKLEQVQRRGGSDLRRRWVASIRRIVRGLAQPDPLRLAQLASLQAQANPFSERTVQEVRQAAMALLSGPSSPEAIAALRDAMWHVSQVRKCRLPFEANLLRLVLGTSTKYWPELDLRIALTLGDQDELKAALDEFVVRKISAGWDAVAALDELGGRVAEDYLRRLAPWHVDCIAPLQVIDALVMIGRHSWALLFLETMLGKDRTGVTQHYVNRFRSSKRTLGVHQGCLMIVECLLKVGDRTSAAKLLSATVPDDLWQTVVEQLDALKGRSFDAAEAMPWVEAFENEREITGLLASYTRALIDADATRLEALSTRQRELLDAFIAELSFKRSDGSLGTLADARTFNAELGALGDGGLTMFTTDSLFCRQDCDFLFWGSRGTIHYSDAKRGEDSCYPLQDRHRSKFGDGVVVLVVGPVAGTDKLMGKDVPVYLSFDEGFDMLDDSGSTRHLEAPEQEVARHSNWIR